MATPIWGRSPASGGLPAVGGFDDPWGSNVQRPSSPPSAPPSDGGSGATPGTFGVDLLNPGESVQQNAVEGTDALTGLKNTLFGTDIVDAKGSHGGILGDIPILGDATRGVSNAVGTVGGGILGLGGKALGAVGGVLEHIDVSSEADKATLQQMFYDLPDSPAKTDALDKIAKDPGAAGHYMSEAVRAHQEDLSVEHPDLYAGMLSMPGSAADTVTNIFGLLGIGQRTVERGIAGAGRPGSGGLNQLQMVLSVGSGQSAWITGNKGSGFESLSPAEQITYQKVTSGEWTEAQGLDFLASHGAGLSHDTLTEIAGTFATDPLTVAALGASALAKVGETGAALLANTGRAERALAALEAAGTASEAEIAAARVAVDVAKAADATKTIAEVGSSASRNVLGRIAETQQGTAIVRLLSAPYVAIQDTALGRAAKAVRTIVDPLHAMGDIHLPGSQAEVDLMSDVVSRSVVDAHGPVNHLKVLEALHGVAPELYDQFVQNLSVYSANVMRRVIGTQHRASILAAGFSQARELLAKGPDEVVEGLLKGRPKNILDSIKEEAQRFRIRAWDEPALDNLAQRMETFYGVKDAGEWRTAFAKMNPDQLSLLHASTYGKATQELIGAVNTATREGSGLSDKLHRLVLLNRDTLTTIGAQGILDRIASAGNIDEAVTELRAALEQYPQLRYFTFEPAIAERSVERFVQMLKAKLEHLPMQVTADEAKTLHPKLSDLAGKIEGSYTLGFRPEDEFLWGLDRVNVAEGRLAPVGDVWTGHVGADEAGPGYQAARYLNLNFAGKPIVGLGSGTRNVGRMIVKPLDYLDAMGRVMRGSVSGSMIMDAARSKFVAEAGVRHGLTSSEAGDILKALDELTGATSTVANPRGLATSNMWAAVRPLVPKRLIGKFTDRDALALILDAYDGDIRFVGATQKLTSRAKAVLGNATGVNFLGQVSEHLYPLIKYRLNVMFQLQEKIEPWVLNAQRGAQVAIGTKMSPADLVTQRNLENLVSTSLVRMGDADQFEYSLGVLHSAGTGRVAAQPASALGRIRAFSSKLTDVQGVKRINMLRTFRKGLGKELKSVWEEHSPGVWQDMKLDAEAKVGHLISDDDFAVQVMGEQLMGNDVVVQRIVNQAGGTDFKADFKAAIAPGQWAIPSHMGEMKPLELDTMAQLLGFSGRSGKELVTSGDLRAAIAAGDITIEDVSDALLRHGADLDYVRRVENAMSFSWEGFWKTVGERYNMLDNAGRPTAELRALEEMLAGSAELRGMTPIDYVSQVFNPTVTAGQEAAVGSLGKAVEVMRGGKPKIEGDLAQLRAPVTDGEYAGTREDLIKQLSSVFSEHLDPSAKWALLQEFRPELRKQVLAGNLRMDLKDLKQMWDQGAEDDLAKQIMGYMDPSAGDFFEANKARNATEYLAKRPALTKPVAFRDPDTKATIGKFQEALGPGLLSQPEDLQSMVVSELDRLQVVTPEVPVSHFDITNLGKIDPVADGAAGVTYGSSKGSVILLDDAVAGPDWKAKEAFDVENNAMTAQNVDFTDFEFGGRTPRKSNPGVPFSADGSILGTVRHEHGHAVYEYITSGKNAKDPRFDELRAFYDRFQESPAAKQISEYTMYHDIREGSAEVTSEALNPASDLSRFNSKPAPVNPDNAPIGSDFSDVPAHLRPDFAGVEGAPQTAEEAITELRQLLEKSGLMKVPPPVSANPDVVRASQMFGKWSTRAIHQGLLKGGQSRFSSLLEDVARIPTDSAVPYDLTKARMVQAATDAMTAKWRDAYRLQYFSQSRTMLERSVNHPMFGIYPASYMWGKVLPELAKFVATSPFGLKTGAMAYSLLDVQKAINVQREFDPEFDAAIDKLGHSQTLWMLGYLLPAVPWDVSSSFPTWLRTLALQGLTSESSVAAGGLQTQPDLFAALKKQAEVINPFRAADQAHRAASEIDDFLHTPATLPVVPSSSAPNTDASQGPVQGSDLGPTLEQQMQQLQAILGH